MRWSCPHCGVNLAVADEKLGSGWSFSRCYKCGGFALVRKAEVNLIKVDRAPVGENVLLPESSETPVLSRDAAKNLAEIVNSAAKPVTAPVQKQNPTADTVPNEVPKFLTENPEPGFSDKGNMLNHVVSARTPYRLLPMAIGLTGLIAVASGIYLYIQGEAIWKKIQTPTREVARNLPAEVTAPNPQPTPVALLTANLAPIVTDSLKQSAMAPARTTDGNAKAVQDAMSSANGAVNDADDEAAMVNDRSLTVRVKAANTKLRGGPGMSYAIRGFANPTTEYTVLEWRDRWFKVGPKSAVNADQYSAWVRNDLVEIIRDK